MAQRQLGAARTSVYYAAAPFVGILLSWLVLRESVSSTFIGALVIMVASVFLIVSEKRTHEHQHVRIEHDHGHIQEEQTHQLIHLPDSHHRHGHNQG